MSSGTTEVLRAEHVWILQVAGVLERILEDEPRRGSLDLDACDACVRFFRLFADACHHGKEEDLLFPELQAVGMSRHAGPVAVMLEEHRRGRAHVRAMAEALEGVRGGDEDAVLGFVDAAFAYIELIRGHILKEDHVLFEMADQMVPVEARARLCRGYDGVCARRFEGCTKAELQDLARELRGRYPPPGPDGGA